MDNDDLCACENCASMDFIVDYERGDRVCSGCGAVADRLMVSVASYREVFDRTGTRVQQVALSESYRSGAFTENVLDARSQARQQCATKSAPYKASTYFAERISQWRSKEPEIPAWDWRTITDMFDEFTGHLQQSKLPPMWQRDRELCKEDIRLLLWEIDKREPTAAKRCFVKKYLVSLFCVSFLLLHGRCALRSRCDHLH